MKLHDGRSAANRAMSPNDLVTYDGVNRPGILSVGDSRSLTESTITTRLVPSDSGCENPLPSQDFDFDTVHLEIMEYPTELVDGSSVRQFFFEAVSGTRYSHQILPSIPQSDVSCGSGTEDTEGEKQWGFIVRTL